MTLLPVVLAFAFALLLLYLWWGITCLPGERWQFIAAAPVEKRNGEEWTGLNFTWYGLLTANAYLASVVVLLILLGSVGVRPLVTCMFATAMLGCCVPASKLVALLVEKKSHTFTVGGAVFVGIIVTPFVIWGLNAIAGGFFSFHIPLIPAYAAVATAYAFGEGLGRLACISFGCCYGKPMDGKNTFLGQLFGSRSFTFHGATKKISYAGGLEAVPVIPVQALTAMINCTIGIIASWLFLSARYTAAFLLASLATQAWRTFSETMRADYRGEGRISAYQLMGAAGLVYALVAVAVLGNEPVTAPELYNGLKSVWNPGTILFLQMVWVILFVYTGASRVTASTVRFHVRQDRI
ncbi:MAG TPA: prolipoprotein diacylglyceryl transferase [Desulfuromonadales bacterium]|nr:prolipoprotein diacylglyceryl transferase [Desulfuromonadales bacterium]